jgi:hypothetical protein
VRGGSFRKVYWQNEKPHCRSPTKKTASRSKDLLENLEVACSIGCGCDIMVVVGKLSFDLLSQDTANTSCKKQLVDEDLGSLFCVANDDRTILVGITMVFLMRPSCKRQCVS